MLDITVYVGAGDPYRLVASAESEAFEGHDIYGPGKKLSGSENNDYLWDLWKLLQVPSPLRLFVARITRKRRADGADRCEVLRQRIEDSVKSYQNHRGYQAGDRIFSIVLPSRTSYVDVMCDGWSVEADGQVVSLASAPWCLAAV